MNVTSLFYFYINNNKSNLSSCNSCLLSSCNSCLFSVYNSCLNTGHHSRCRALHHFLSDGQASKTAMDSEEAEKYIRLVKKQQQRDLQKLNNTGHHSRCRALHHFLLDGQASRTAMNSEEAEKYIRLVKEQQQRGLQKLKGGGGGDGGFSYKVDPYCLRFGDYVVHKKVSIGRFVVFKCFGFYLIAVWRDWLMWI
jgi:RNase P subunit RPR2